ncbi:hypothetical protein ACA910_010125 [Epithemia clementina (nom. ined.)]
MAIFRTLRSSLSSRWWCLLLLTLTFATTKCFLPSNAILVEATDLDDQDINENLGVLTTAKHGQRQIDWVRSKGGFVHSSFEIRRVDPDDDSSRYGVFAKTDISKSELILSIPRECVIQPPMEFFEDWEICDTVEILAREMQRGKSSVYEPYVTYLKTQATRAGQLPTVWSDAGKSFLVFQLLGAPPQWIATTTTKGKTPSTAAANAVLLPPKNSIRAGSSCDERNEYERQAHMLTTQRSWDELLIPVWDMVSHRNGHWTNVAESYSVFDIGHPITVHATRDIRAGEELYMTYDHCPDCQGRSRNYGTPEILRDYGFVESLPQKWVLHDQQVSFTLDSPPPSSSSTEKNGNDDNHLVIKWHSKRPDVVTLEFLENQLTRLSKLNMNHRPTDIAVGEWEILVQYHAALSRALQYAVSDTRRAMEPSFGGGDNNSKYEQCRLDLETAQAQVQDALQMANVLLKQAQQFQEQAAKLHQKLMTLQQDTASVVA